MLRAHSIQQANLNTFSDSISSIKIRVKLSRFDLRLEYKYLRFITGSFARIATRWYVSYSEADFEVFRPAGATHCTDGDEIWHKGGQITSPSVRWLGYSTPKLKCLLRFDQNMEYKRPAGRIFCAISTKFAEFVAVSGCVSC